MSASSPAVMRTIVTRGDAQIEVLAQGQGHPIVLLPSLGRGASDFDADAWHARAHSVQRCSSQ